MYLIVFDMETAGLLDTHPEIQLAAVAVDNNWNEMDSFEQKIQFDVTKADPEALKLNHYDPEAWKEALAPGAVAAKFAKFIEPFKSVQMVSKRTGVPYSVARLAGHNAATFDAPRLRRMFSNAFLPAHPIPLDTLQLAMWWAHRNRQAVDSYKLSELCKLFGIATDGAHDALTDVRMTVSLAQVLCAALFAGTGVAA